LVFGHQDQIFGRAVYNSTVYIFTLFIFHWGAAGVSFVHYLN